MFGQPPFGQPPLPQQGFAPFPPSGFPLPPPPEQPHAFPGPAYQPQPAFMRLRQQPQPFQLAQHRIFPHPVVEFAAPVSQQLWVTVRMVRLAPDLPPGPALPVDASKRAKRSPMPNLEEQPCPEAFDEDSTTLGVVPVGRSEVAFYKLILSPVKTIKGPHAKTRWGFKEKYALGITATTQVDSRGRCEFSYTIRSDAFELLSNSKQLPPEIAAARNRSALRQNALAAAGVVPSSPASAASSPGGGGRSSHGKREDLEGADSASHSASPSPSTASDTLTPLSHAATPNSGTDSAVRSPAGPDAPIYIRVCLKDQPTVLVGKFELPTADATFTDLRHVLNEGGIDWFDFWHNVFDGKIQRKVEHRHKVVTSLETDDEPILIIFHDIFSLWPNDQTLVPVDAVTKALCAVYGYGLLDEDKSWVEIGVADFFLNKTTNGGKMASAEDMRLFLTVFGGTDRCLAKVVDLYSAAFFHGFMNATQANERLVDNPGRFLFRFSEKHFLSGSIAFHVNRKKETPNGPMNVIESYVLFYRRDGTYSLDEQGTAATGVVSPTIQGFVQRFSPKLGLPLLNVTPLPANMRRRYWDANLFLGSSST